MVGYVPQQVASFNVGFPSTVLELVQSGRYQRGKWFKKLNKEDKEQVKRALESVGMWDMRYKKIGELSGGQKQRISIARVFATDPDLFVLDEPTTGMDTKSREEFYKLLKHYSEAHGKGILMVTHDHDELRKYCNKHIELIRRWAYLGDVSLWIHAKSFPGLPCHLINCTHARIVSHITQAIPYGRYFIPRFISWSRIRTISQR